MRHDMKLNISDKLATASYLVIEGWDSYSSSQKLNISRNLWTLGHLLWRPTHISSKLGNEHFWKFSWNKSELSTWVWQRGFTNLCQPPTRFRWHLLVTPHPAGMALRSRGPAPAPPYSVVEGLRPALLGLGCYQAKIWEHLWSSEFYVEFLISLRLYSQRASSKVLLFPCRLKFPCITKPSISKHEEFKHPNTKKKKVSKNNRCTFLTSSVSFLITIASTPSFGGEACEAPIVHKHRENALT